MFRLKDRTPMETGRFDAAVHSEGLTLGSCGPVRPAFVDSVRAHIHIVLRTESQPGCKGGRIAKSGYVCADLLTGH
jgi:hypothetical protein